MKSDLKNFLIKICDWVLGLTAIFFIGIFIICKFEGVTAPFKEAISISVSFLSALATLAAAIIAARLFQTWKIQHSYVEQIKILSEMIKCINDMLNHLAAARENENLIKVILDIELDGDINESFAEQQKNAKLLELSLLNLGQLENQIYLLNNDKKEQPVFNSDGNESCTLENLLTFSYSLQQDINKIYEYVFEDLNSTGHSTYKSFDVDVELVQILILNTLSNGGMALKMVAPNSSKSDYSGTNKQLSKWAEELTDQIMAYRDSLDTLN